MQELSKQLDDANQKCARMESGVKAQGDHCHSLTKQVAVLKEAANKMESECAKLKEENQLLKQKVSVYT